MSKIILAKPGFGRWCSEHTLQELGFKGEWGPRAAPTLHLLIILSRLPAPWLAASLQQRSEANSCNCSFFRKKFLLLKPASSKSETAPRPETSRFISAGAVIVWNVEREGLGRLLQTDGEQVQLVIGAEEIHRDKYLLPFTDQTNKKKKSKSSSASQQS